MSKTAKRPAIRMPTVEEDRAIIAAAKADPDAQPLTPKQLDAMVPMKSLRGRPKAASTKQLVSIRYSPEVIEYFKSTGEGWQAKMDGVLLRYVARHSREG
ncbi:MAG: BrnA antitoxin family protein [Uliginosibacterium sp.]|nr:BrnA antitoxin family protein [Uliginosibacterium sp.]